MEFNPGKTNLHVLTKETISQLHQWAKNKDISVTNDLSKNRIVEADKSSLTAIIRNLLSNAIKFTPKGGKVLISDRFLTDKNQRNFIEITVADNGVGILPESQTKLFDISENISTPGTEKETGTGLGLIICKDLVEKHRGKIWVESNEKTGSKFIFTIPTII
jgi:signal transduction histidine kinase